MPQVTFLPDGATVEVPAGTTLLEAAQRAHAQVGHACGGKRACSTCHVYVRDGGASLTPARENEEDVLDQAFDVRPQSRLSCQARLGNADVRVEITRESRQAYLDEHPDERAGAADAARLLAG